MKQITLDSIKENRTKIQKYFFMREKILLRKFKKGKIKENTKERMIDWCEEYKLNRITLLNYTERGKIGKLPLILIMLLYLIVL